MTETCPAGSIWTGHSHFIIGEMRWTSDGHSVMVNRCIRCGAEEITDAGNQE